MQSSLDVAGLTPGAGIGADAVNTAVSLFRGNFVDAGLNAFAAIPIFGTGSKLTELAANAAKALDKSADAAKSAGAAGGAFQTAKRAGDKVVEGVRVASRPSKLPNDALAFTGKSGIQEVFKRLQKFHGIDPKLASKRLHELKANLGYAPDADLLFDSTGNVFDPKTREWIGSLTEGGAKARF